MKIKLTARGRFIVYALLFIATLLAVGFVIFFVFQMGDIPYSPTPSNINCVADTVLQPDGSCSPMER